MAMESLASDRAGAEGEPSFARRLADHLATLTPDLISDRARALGVMAMVDTIGVTLVGAGEESGRIVRGVLDTASSPGPALVLGTSLRTRVIDAAYINGTAAHAIDYDDMARNMGGHPSVPVLPAVLALGEANGLTARAAVEAFIVGYEAECRIGRVVHLHHYQGGWHPTSTLGVFGAAAAAARVLRLTPEVTATALSIAASSASGVKANFGSMVKPLHVGQAARDGLTAALLAARGFDAGPRAFEHKEGFFQAYDGLENVNPGRLLDQAGEILEIEQPQTGLKQFPCCGSTHPAILAMLDLVSSDDITPEEVASIAIRTHRMRLPHTDNPRPQTPLAAKFSIQYATVRALLDRNVRMSDFEGDAFAQPAVATLLGRVTTSAFAAGEEEGREMDAEVSVVLTDGRRLTGSVKGALGRGPANPMSDAEMWRKFSDCAAVVMDAPQARRAYDTLQRLDESVSLAEILAPLADVRAVGQGFT